jgi:hypothetical protein
MMDYNGERDGERRVLEYIKIERSMLDLDEFLKLLREVLREIKLSIH